ncbi:MAG: hypothetical protein M1834_002309 [Cirrosporium novae-zelandiae]|nr:MAG: hypothetical protein M1834_002309 [Cirrosporium novae-zelandiae]
MRGKRSKQYRKLMQQYALHFGFREPYQVLLDAQIIQDAERFKMDLVGGLERTLHGKVKPMITQCSMRHLYKLDPPSPHIVDIAKSYERRRCNHHELPEPLSELDCITSVVDTKSNRVNKHRLVVATQEQELRRDLREIPGVPLVYIKKSVMVMEPMADATEKFRDGLERGKFREGIKGKRRGAGGVKRKRENGEGAAEEKDGPEAQNTQEEEPIKKKRKQKGPKEPNPLSVKKSKKKVNEGLEVLARKQENTKGEAKLVKTDEVSVHEKQPTDGTPPSREEGEGETKRRKRKRKHKSGQGGEEGGTGVPKTDDVSS